MPFIAQTPSPWVALKPFKGSSGGFLPLQTISLQPTFELAINNTFTMADNQVFFSVFGVAICYGQAGFS
jgi:hypothetical protein